MEAVAIIATLDSVIEQTSAIKKLTEKYPNFSEKIIRQELKRLHKKKKPSACNAEMPEDIGKAFDLPVGVHVPSRYRVMECGVYALEARGEKHIEYTKIIHTPIVVAKKAKDNESGVVGVQLYFLYDEKPRVVNVDQEVIA
jgi:hypothetical protein